MSDKIFADGIFFKEKNVKAPDFVLGGIDFKVDEAIAFLKKHKNDKGYVNLDLKVSKGGKKYLELNNYKKSENLVDNSPGISPEQVQQIETLKNQHNKQNEDYNSSEVDFENLPF